MLLSSRALRRIRFGMEASPPHRCGWILDCVYRPPPWHFLFKMATIMSSAVRDSRSAEYRESSIGQVAGLW